VIRQRADHNYLQKVVAHEEMFIIVGGGVMEYWSVGVLIKAIVAGYPLRIARLILQPVTRNSQQPHGHLLY
jgi:hypothetical protein